MRTAQRSALVLPLALLFAGTPPAHAGWRAPCVPGTTAPACTWWTARTTFVADGDTLRARIGGDRSGRIATIRLTGINAMELHRYSRTASRRRGDCHAVAAANLVDRLVKRAHGAVRLAAQDPLSATGGRLRRSAWVRRGGRWQDLGRLVMQSGLALWLPNPVEYAPNAEYGALAQEAAAAQRGLYAPSACGAGPDQDLPLAIDVNWDADGADGDNLNGEWVQVRNLGARPLSLRGWWLRDSWLRVSPGRPRRPGYAFPASAAIPAGGAIRVHSGCGADGATDFHWCQRASVFDNVTADARHMGDGAYLFDPQGDLRAGQIYPCAVGCQDPLQGRVRITVHPTTPESISVTNVSAEPADVSGHLVKLHLERRPGQFIFAYPFPAGSVLAPGATMQLLLQGAPNTDQPLLRHLGRPAYALADSGNAVSLRSFTDVVVDCVSWGDGRC